MTLLKSFKNYQVTILFSVLEYQNCVIPVIPRNTTLAQNDYHFVEACVLVVTSGSRIFFSPTEFIKKLFVNLETSMVMIGNYHGGLHHKKANRLVETRTLVVTGGSRKRLQ